MYRPLRLHRLTVSLSRPRSDLSGVKPSPPRRPVTPSDKPDKSFSAQTTTGRSLSSLTSTTVANVPVSASGVAGTGRAVTASSPSAAVRDVVKSAATLTPRDSRHVESMARDSAATVGKPSRTLVKSVSADKTKPSLKTSASTDDKAKPNLKMSASTDEHSPPVRPPSVSKSQSTTNVKKHTKSDTTNKEVSKKETKTSVSVKVPSYMFSLHD